VNVSSPISPKLSAYELLSMGYSAGSNDCIMSLSMWQKLMAARMEKVVLPAAWAGLRVAVASLLKKGSSGRASQFAAFASGSPSLILDRLDRCQARGRAPPRSRAA
jgi:hypothetical protein